MNQIDLFLGELRAPATKDDHATMVFPFFSIQKGGERVPVVFRDDRSGTQIEILPSTFGSATIWDKDILIYVGTLIRKHLDEGGDTPSTFTISAGDLLNAIGRGRGGKDYRELERALDRLVGTRFKTNVATDGVVEKENFSILPSYRMLQNRGSRLDRIEITVSDWFFRSIKAAQIATIPPGYFKLRSGIARRIYELIRKHIHQKPHFRIGIDRLRLKCGTERDIRKFRYELKKLMPDRPTRLLDYLVVLDLPMLLAFRDDEMGKKLLLQHVLETGVAKSAARPRYPEAQLHFVVGGFRPALEKVVRDTPNNSGEGHEL